MQIDRKDIEKIADLARLGVADADALATQLSNILDLVAQMNTSDLDSIEPLAHPLELTQPQRDDAVTENNHRQKFQSLAPQTHAGLYIVPQVIEND